MSHLWTDGDWAFFRCATHGTLAMSSQQLTDEPDDSKIRR
jgi:hypothetical protein